MIDIQELPRKDGFPVGQYRLRYSTITVTYFDAKLVDGVTVEPITGRTLQRLRMAYGSDCVIEPWDDETRELVAQHLESIGRPDRAAEVRAAGNPVSSTEGLRELIMAVAEVNGVAHRELQRLSSEQLQAFTGRLETIEAELRKLPIQELDESTIERLTADDVAHLRAQLQALQRLVSGIHLAATGGTRSADAPPADAGQIADQGDAGNVGLLDAVEPIIDQDIDKIDDKAVLMSIAAGLGIEFSGGWSRARLRNEIRKARQAQ